MMDLVEKLVELGIDLEFVDMVQVWDTL